MRINDKEIGFAVTLGALKELLERCPNGDITQIEKLFTGQDMTTMLENMAWFVRVLNKWYLYRETRSFEGAITEDDVFSLEIDEIQQMFTTAMKAFHRDRTPETEVEPTKK